MGEVEMEVYSIRVSLRSDQRVVILKEVAGDRQLPIWVGPTEADSIAVKLQEVRVPRPLTHDFFLSAVKALGGSIRNVVINKLEGDMFHAVTRIKRGDELYELDCRPSDAMAVAIRATVPILAVEDGGVEKAFIR